MLFLALAIGAALPSLAWSNTVTIDNKPYDADCTIKRIPLWGGGPAKIPVQDSSESCVVRGIPYATAKRFERPRPLTESERKELTQDKTAVHCAQRNPFGEDIIGVEDTCLVVDLYFPKDFLTSKSNPLPHLVVLMEGIDFESSLAGHLNHKIYLDSSLEEKHMVAVVHYRTGPFGFMTLRDPLMPANLGLWDQQLALKFLKNNTAALNVNDNFVILGFGSGAVSLHFHMLNTASRGMFKKVLLSGGNALSPGALQSDPLNTTMTLAQRLKCDVSSTSSVSRCLREKPVTDILEKVSEAPVLRFAPSVDTNASDTTLEYTFISESVEDLVAKEDLKGFEVVIHGYPALTGLGLFAKNDARAKAEDDGVDYLSLHFNAFNNRTAKSVAKAVLDQFLTTDSIRTQVKADPTGLIQNLSDFTAGYPIRKLVTTHLRKNLQNTADTAVRLESYVVVDTSSETGTDTETLVPSLASSLRITKNIPKEVLKFGSILDDMLLFIGCNDIKMYTQTTGGTLTVSSHITGNLRMMSRNLKCLLNKVECSEIETELKLDPTNGAYTGQKVGQSSGNIYRNDLISKWSSVLSLASAMDKLEVDNRALEQAIEKKSGVNSAGASFWGMVVGLILLAIIVLVLAGLLVKMVRDKRQGTTVNQIEKPARSGAHYNVGMESVTVEGSDRM